MYEGIYIAIATKPNIDITERILYKDVSMYKQHNNC